PHREIERRARQDLERRFCNEAERAERAGDEARDVVARDVLHHLPAKLHHAAAAVDKLHAEYVVAQCACACAPGSREPGRNAASKRGGTEVWRLERQAL